MYGGRCEESKQLTSIEPENKRFILRGSGGLSEPVEECSSMFFIDSDIA